MNSSLSQPLLTLESIAKAYGPRTILHNVTLALHLGEIVSLLGASGCGKSTLLRIAAGLDSHYRGRCHYPRAASRTGMVFQEPRLLPWLTVEQNIGFADARHADMHWVQQLMRDVGLARQSGKLPRQLSGGQAQRVAIARAIYQRPDILLLDEPFSAVDPFTRMTLQHLLLDLARQYTMTVLLVTHDLDEAFWLSDRVIMLGGEPAQVLREVAVDIPHPRERHDPRLSTLRAGALDLLIDNPMSGP